MSEFRADFLAWVDAGLETPKESVPEEVKWGLLLELAEEYHLRTLIETGTAVGDTILHIQNHFEEIHSFEIMGTYYEVAVRNTEGLSHVILYNSSSASSEFRDLVNKQPDPCLIYLDAHYSGEGTGKDLTLITPDVPIRQELDVILQSNVDHVIVIDDARCFKGEAFYTDEYLGYPSRSEIQDQVAEFYDVAHVADAFVLHPKGWDWE